jgi:orotidine-5'-phosphate decarboxylase
MSVGHSTKSPEEHTEPRIAVPPRPSGTCLERLRARWQNAGTFLCVGLDSDFDRLPPPVQRNHTTMLGLEDDRQGAQIEGALVTFNEAIIDATADLVCAFKPNSAFYEAYGPPGLRALVRTIAYIHARYPEVPVILDAKRGDIGSTSRAYARAAFDAFSADAVTLHPYLGHKALAPFLERADRLAFILCRTSNPGADELQELRVQAADSTPGAGSGPLYLTVAQQVASEWNVHGNCGLVVGATYPEELRRVRAQVGGMPILVPGVGAQGGDLEATVRAGMDADGQGLIISVSRAVIYASDGLDFAAAARREAQRLWREIRDLRQVSQP